MYHRYAFALVPLLLACHHSVPRPELAAIGAELPRDAGVVKAESKGDVGAPVVVIEENHSSRAGQLEAAMVLSQLHDRFGLRDVVLEGFLKEDEGYGTRPDLANKGTSLERARYAARFVGEGDISGAEFAALVFTDVTLHPAETTGEYSSDLKIDGPIVLTVYLGQVALNSLDQESGPKVVAYAQSLESDPEYASRSEEEKALIKAVKVSEFTIGLNPWAKEASAKKDDRTKSIEEEIRLIESVIRRGEESHAQVQQDLRGALDQYLEFLRKRSAASVTIVNSVGAVADDPDIPIVAVNIGAGHTDRVCFLLKEAHRPFVLLSLNSLHDEKNRGNLELEELDRKYKREPVAAGLLSNALLELYPVGAGKAVLHRAPDNNKPKPVIQEEWFQAKAELYASTASLVAAVGGGGGGGSKPPDIPIVPNAGSPPDGGDPRFVLGWVPGDPRRKDIETNNFTFINPATIEVLHDNGKPREVLFEANFKDSSGHSKSVWVKAGFVEHGHLSADQESPKTIEDVLKRELDEVKREGPKPEPDDKNISRVQIDVNTKAIVAGTREEARQAEIQY